MKADPFAVFDLPQSPVVDRDDLERRYDDLCRTTRGDAAHRARMELLSPSRRLKHLDGVAAAATAVFPPELVEEFALISPVLAAAEKQGAELRAASSDLARALRFPEARRLQRDIEILRNRLSEALEETERELAALADGWRDHTARLEEIRQACGFREKWLEQLRQAWAGLVV